MTASSEKIQAALAKAESFETFSQHILAGALGWPNLEKAGDPEDLTFEWAESDLRAKGLDRWIKDGRVLQLQNLVRNQRWGIFVVEFAQDVITSGRGMVGPLRQVLRGLVSSARKKAANLPSWSRQDLLFICTYQWKHYAIARFSEPAEKSRVPRLATFGWSADAARRTRTVVTQNLPHLEWPDDVTDVEGWRTTWSQAWDKEALTKDFFRVFAGDQKRGLPGVFHVLRRDILARNKVDDDVAGEKALLILNRMMFLYFIQRKGWLAQDQDFLRKAFKKYEGHPDDTDFFAEKAKAKPYTSGFLSGLFARLATDDSTDLRFSAAPFLNGGLFEPDEVDADLKISNETFRVIFDELLDRYNFTVTEDTPLDVEVAIDPEMLGKIFECLVLQSEMDEGILSEDGKKPKDKRKLTGSYYTPRAIVHFMCQEALKEHLRSHAAGATDTVRAAALDALMTAPSADLVDKEAAAALSKVIPAALAKAWSDALKTIRACDPAVGSGAFVVGLLHEIVRLRSVLDRILSETNPVDVPNYFYNLKHEVIKHSLYGVDLQERAVRLCELRLWLSLVVDYDLWKGAPDAKRTPEEFKRRLRSDLPALPNLSYLIVRGDSLLEWLHGDVIPLQRQKNTKKFADFFQDQKTIDTVRAIGDAKRAFFQSHDATQKHQLAASILDYKASLIERLLEAMFVRAMQAANKDQDLWADDRTADQRKERQEEDARRARYVGALSRVKASRRQLAAHRQKTADPSTASLHELESEIFGDTSEHPAFFWRLDFAEVFAERGGFDIVIANPPYIRMELIKAITPFLKKYYRAAAGRADAYIYFFEQGVGLLRDGGALVYISSSTFAKTGSGKALRTILRDETTLRRFVDFGDLQIFEGVTTYPAIMLLRKEKPPVANDVQGTVVQTLEADALDRELRAPGVIVRQKELEADGWRFEDRRLARLRQKIKDAGVPLKEYCGSPLYGIKTGLNEAFVIDSATRDALVAQDKRSAEILKPFLEGKDLKPWRAEWRGLWLIYTHHGIDMKPYPAVLEHLRTYKKRLEARATAHLHPWWELQQPQEAYIKGYEQPKLVYPHFCSTPKFSYDPKRFYVNNKSYCIAASTVDLHWLLSVMNSSVIWMHLTGICTAMRGGRWRYEFTTQFVETSPIAKPSAADRKKLADLAEALSAESCPNRLALEAELNDRVAHLYGLTAEEQKIVNGILPAAKDDGGDEMEEG